LCHNYIKKIPIEIKYLTKLITLNLFWNKIKKIPEEIKYLTELKVLQLKYNKIKIIPSEIKYLTELNILDIFHNHVIEIPNEIQYLIKLESLILSENKITIIPSQIFNLTELKILLINNNKICQLPKEIQYLIKLEILYIQCNNLTILPLEIINLKNLKKFPIFDNEIENLLNPIIYRFINKIKSGGGNIHNFYNNNQNIHSSSIQESIKNSIFNLMENINNINDNLIDLYLNDDILPVKIKNILIEYLNDTTVHSQLECTFKEVLYAVLLEINKLPLDIQIEVKNRLNEELNDGLYKCFTGRISRLVNSLSGYSDKVLIKISSSEEIGNIISIMIMKYDDIDDIIKNVSLELKERGYDQETISKWINFI